MPTLNCMPTQPGSTPPTPTANVFEDICEEIRTGPFSILGKEARDRIILFVQWMENDAYTRGVAASHLCATDLASFNSTLNALLTSACEAGISTKDLADSLREHAEYVNVYVVSDKDKCLSVRDILRAK
jgi:hypothetical protein